MKGYTLKIWPLFQQHFNVFNNFNISTDKKENIREDKECLNKLNHQQENQLSKEKTIGDSMIKNITGKGISRENIIKMRSHYGATTIDICNYIKPELHQKPD